MRGRVFLLAAAIVLAATAARTVSGQKTDAGSSHGATYEKGCKAFDEGFYYTAFYDLLPFAARGDAKAQFAIGEMLRTGSGTPRNREEALIWYRRSAEQGFTPAQCNLGVALFNGWGARADPQAAIDWWLRAALNGNAHAMFNLGTVIARGRHVKRDFVIAYWWLMRASENGYVGADDVLATLRKVMTPAQVARARNLETDDATAFIRRPLTSIHTEQETLK